MRWVVASLPETVAVRFVCWRDSPLGLGILGMMGTVVIQSLRVADRCAFVLPLHFDLALVHWSLVVLLLEQKVTLPAPHRLGVPSARIRSLMVECVVVVVLMGLSR